VSAAIDFEARRAALRLQRRQGAISERACAQRLRRLDDAEEKALRVAAEEAKRRHEEYCRRLACQRTQGDLRQRLKASLALSPRRGEPA